MLADVDLFSRIIEIHAFLVGLPVDVTAVTTLSGS